MESIPVIKNITVYPVKSLDGVSLTKSRLSSGGCLEHDREFAIFDQEGKYVNGKSNPLVHLLRSKIDFEKEQIAFRHETDQSWDQFHLNHDKTEINSYLSTFFKAPVTLEKNTAGKFLDIPVKSGMTVLSTASLETVSAWFDNVEIAEIRKRFRATIEISNVPAFWEDRLFDHRSVIEFKMGDVLVYGMSPRARCVVPTRHPGNGEVYHAFQRSFAVKRTANLPEWSTLADFKHAYYLSVDCYIPPGQFGKWVSIGDELQIMGKKQLNELARFDPGIITN